MLTPRLKGLRFRPRKWALALVLVASVALVSLGNWQARRAQEKRDLAARVERAGLELPMAVPGRALPPETLGLRRLLAKGEFLPQFTVLLDNKVYRGRPGYYVVTPLRIAGSSMHVLVNRGWIPAGQRREDLPAIATPEGEVVVEGLGQAHAPRVFSPGESPPAGKVWQSLTFEGYSKWAGLALQPVFLEQHSSLPDGLVRDWPRVDFGVEKHESYSMQWYLFAMVAILIFIVLSFERVRPASR